MMKNIFLYVIIVGVLSSVSARASYPIRSLDDVIPCFRAEVGIRITGHMAITNEIAHARFTVMMERALQKQLQLVRSAAKGKGDTDQVKKIDRIAAELKKEKYLLRALKTLKDAKETIDQPSFERLIPPQPPETK